MLQTIDAIVGKTLKIVATSCFVALFLLLFINVVARTFELAGFAWFDEIVQGLFAWMVFIGAAALWREKEHFTVLWLEHILGDNLLAALLKIVIILLCLFFLVTVTFYGYDFLSRNNSLTPILQIPTSVHYVVIPIAGLIMTVYTLRDLLVTSMNIFKKTGNKKNDL